jgi:hypothetical protein
MMQLRVATMGLALVTLCSGVVIGADPPAPRPLPKAPLKPFPSFEERIANRKKEPVKRGYLFVSGQSFAYRVEILIDEGDQVVRYAGTPFFMVHDVDDKAETDIEVIGRLVHATGPKGSTTFTDMDMGDIWIASRIVIGPWGEPKHSRKDYNLDKLPTLFDNLTNLKGAIFPQIASHYHGERTTVEYSDGSATLMSRKTNGFFPTIDTSKGRRTDSIIMEPAETDRAKLTTEHSFHTSEDSKREWKYTSAARFDLKRGLLLESAGQYEYESATSAKPMRITMKLLDGEEFRQARDRSIDDRRQMPSDLVPQEFKRTRITNMPHLPKRYKNPDDLKPGDTAAHLNDHDYRWYTAVMVEAIDAYKVKVRYRGSNEEFDIHVGQLAPLPVAK